MDRRQFAFEKIHMLEFLRTRPILDDDERSDRGSLPTLKTRDRQPSHMLFGVNNKVDFMVNTLQKSKSQFLSTSQYLAV
jgi:hypothetical protein